MVQMPGNQHMGPMNRTMLPPNGPPNMSNHIPGNQQQAHSPNYPQPPGRPSSRPSTPGQGVITNPSPSMTNRLPPGGIPPSMNEINGELMRIPNTLLPKIKQELMIPHDKDLAAMTPEEKHRILVVYRGKYRIQPQPGPGAPQQPPNPAGPSSTPLMTPANVRNNPPAQQRAKRNSTSPGEEEGSSPKRPRPSPSGGDHPNPPGPPQNQPPMASMVPFNPQAGGGPPGPQNMQNGMMRPQMNMAYQSMTGFGSPMSPGMVSIPTPAMMNNPVHMTPEMHNYRQSMQKLHHKAMGPPLVGNNAGSPLSNPPQTAGPAPFNAGNMNTATVIKPVGGMMPPPPSPGINKVQQNGGEKPSEPGARPGSSPGQGPQPGPQNPGQPQQPPSTTQQSQQPPQLPQQQPPANQPGPGQGPPTNPAPATPSAPPSMGAEATSGLIDLQQSAMGGLGDLTWDIGDFDQTFLRQDPGDLNFERDFGQWFNPGGDVTLDMK
ncbi:hypothetical protein BDM02DRAFT_2207585 [Thelephora ganbajun]|uniref:Uncharacterized protein n=1 Tax=Thelephora ganbajun TaxID=370292 RepID=A0ACB6ZGS1_THEGA|nr:hypothetical protein BDM02DRAFT_2207585 [Thelephora ganbajun]